MVRFLVEQSLGFLKEVVARCTMVVGDQASDSFA
jgi:hypothetical protein